MSTSRDKDVKDLAEAQEVMEPLSTMPALEQRARSYFDSYTQGKNLADWFEHELISVGHLARLSVIVDGILGDIEDNGSAVAINPNTGAEHVHPSITALKTMMALELSAIKSLRLAVKDGRDKPSTRRQISRRRDKTTGAKSVNFKGNLLAQPD